jgi:CubicO group peptidase (beta-lactamase class C family)
MNIQTRSSLWRSGTALLLLLVLPVALGAQEPRHEYVEYTIANPAAVKPFEEVDPKAAGIDPAALERLVKRAEETHSDSLVILKDGKLVGDWRFGKPAQPIEAMSVTKSIVNLAIGRLVETGKIASIDAPVTTFYPEWKGTRREKIKIRHLLDHTSGLAANRNAMEVYQSGDIVRLALDAAPAQEPGAEFFYNNKAVNLLAGIVEKASGRKLDEYLRDELFAPLGVTRFSWMRDSAGNPHGMAGVKLDALDLARIGQLMLDQGTFQGRRLLSPEWVAASVQPAQQLNPGCGLLWWVLSEWAKLEITPETMAAWRQGGADPAFLDKVAPLQGKALAQEDFYAEMNRIFGPGQGLPAYAANVMEKRLPLPKTTRGPQIGFHANGYLGQYIQVLTGPRIVAVRQIRQESHKGEADGFEDFGKLVRALVPAK